MLRTLLLVILLSLTLFGALVRAAVSPTIWRLARLQHMTLAVDANRDGLVDDRDRSEQTWAGRPEDPSAIVLANTDDDDGDHVPDNWRGGDFDYRPGDEPADERVNADPDLRDLASLVLRRPGLASFPSDIRIVLRVVHPAHDDPYYAATPPQDLVRIFLPTRSSGDDLIVQAGDEAIIGPTTGDMAEFVASPQPPQYDIALLAGKGALHLGVEGLHYNALVDIVVESWQGSAKLGEGWARMRVAPFILADHSQPVSREARPKSVYVEDLGQANAELRASLRELYGADHVAEVKALDRWQQDGYEIGYSQAPYGSMWVILGLPRGELAYTTTVYGAVEPALAFPGARRVFEPYRMSSLNYLARQQLLSPGVGLISDFQDIGYTGAEAGGNLEAVPGSPARYLYGSRMRPEIIDFIEAQEQQCGTPVDTSLLAVGHVDELVSYAPDGSHILLADPEVAWALLLIANSLAPGAEMLHGLSPEGEARVTVGQIVSGQSPRTGEIAGIRDYNLRTLMAPDRLPALWTGLGLGSAAGVPVADAANRGAAILSRVGGLVGFMPPENIRSGLARTFAVTFQDAQHYTLAYRDGDAGSWTLDGVGAIDRDIVSLSRTAFLFAHWWHGGAPQVGDRFVFVVDPSVPWVQIPVLYRDNGGGEGVALTSNHVNALIDGATIVTAEAHGPQVDLGAGLVDILDYYVRRELERAGYQRVVAVDDRAYHVESGSVHCATNVFRALPPALWWDQAGEKR